MPDFHIGNRIIGVGHPCFIVAELSGNHHQNYEEAVKLIYVAKEAGADAVKLQTYTPDTITIDSPKEWFIVAGKDNPDGWKGKTLYELYQTAYTPWEWQPKLKKIADEIGIMLFSSPFDETAVDFLEKMQVPCYKVASYEVTHIPLLRKIANTGKPVILSIGFASLEEVELAIETLREGGTRDIAVLHCVTSYADEPKPEDMHLATIGDIRERFNVVSGFSDNNGGIEIPLRAAMVGASIIEKHFILNRTDAGPDAKFSLEPHELKTMIEKIREAEKAIGSVHYGPVNDAEEYNKRFRRSIFVVEDIKKGEVFTGKNVRVIRPGNGLHSKFFDQVVGKRALENIERGTPLQWNLLI